MCLKIAVLEQDSAVLCHKLLNTIKRLELIIVKDKSDYDFFTKSFAKNDAHHLCYTSCAAELVAELIYKYNVIMMNDLLEHM